MSVAISPYKGFFDSLTRNEISPEGREQLEWLLDSRFSQYVETIAQGRRTTAESVQAMIDASPLSAADALDAGYVDAVMTEERCRLISARSISSHKRALNECYYATHARNTPSISRCCR